MGSPLRKTDSSPLEPVKTLFSKEMEEDSDFSGRCDVQISGRRNLIFPEIRPASLSVSAAQPGRASIQRGGVLRPGRNAKASLARRRSSLRRCERASPVAAKLAAGRSSLPRPVPRLAVRAQARGEGKQACLEPSRASLRRLEFEPRRASLDRRAQAPTGRGKLARGRSSLARHNPDLFRAVPGSSSPVEAWSGRRKLESPGASLSLEGWKSALAAGIPVRVPALREMLGANRP